MALLDQFGNPLGVGLGGKISRMLQPFGPKVFEGAVSVKRYDDAIEGTGTCAHCGGKIVQVVRMDPAEVTKLNLTENDLQKVLFDKIQEHHECGARLHDGKTYAKDWLKTFE